MSMIDMSDMEKRIAERVTGDTVRGIDLSQHAGGLAFNSMSDAMEFAKIMAVSQIGIRKHLRGNVGACLAVTIQAVEWGISPFAVANKCYLVNDQLAFESQLIQAVILKRAPIKGRFRFSFDGDGVKRKCTASATLNNGDIVQYTSPEVGKIPVKNSPLWKGDEDQQLCYYSGRALCRRHFPDVLLGIYAPEELEYEPALQGPERARDVSPPKTIAAKLDTLAADHSETIDHDPATGEITETDASGATPASQAARETAGGADRAKTESLAAEQTDDVREALLAGGRAAAMDGRRSLDAWYAALTDEQRDSLSDQTASLLAAANRVGA